jgi:hypothetical protein
LSLLVLLLSVAGAAGELSRESRGNRTEARTDVARQLSALSLPPGTTALSSQRARAVLRHFLFTCQGQEFTPYLNAITQRRYRQVSEDPSSVVSWVRAHAPKGSRLTSSGQTPTRSGGTVWYLTFGFPSDPDHILQRCVGVVVKRRANGSSGIGVESQATWVLTRPKWDFVPRATRLITVTLDLAGAHSKPVTLTAPRAVKRIVRMINHAEVVQPGLRHCPRGRSESYRMVFRARSTGPALARATANLNGCTSLFLSVRGQRGPILDAGWPLGELLPRVGAVRGCARQALVLVPHGINVWHGQHTAAYQLTDRSDAPCEVDGRTTVTLLEPSGRSQQIPISGRDFAPPWLIGSRSPVAIAVAWTHSCSRDRVTRVRVSIAGLPPSFTLRTGRRRRFAPCRATVRAGPEFL